LAVLIAGAAPSGGQELINREYKIKAAYLYNFGRYVEWPAAAFANETAPLTIGIVGPDPLGEDLDQIVQVKTIEGRPIQVRRFADPREARACHILFLSRALEEKARTEVLHRLSKSGSLFVGETPEFLDQGGVICFVIQENNVRLVVSLKSAQREELKISSKLLRLAQVVN
jgi:hypothetical protein